MDRQSLTEQRRQLIRDAISALEHEDWATVASHAVALLDVDQQIVACVVADSQPLAETDPS